MSKLHGKKMLCVVMAVLMVVTSLVTSTLTSFADTAGSAVVSQDFEKFDQTDKQANTGANKTPFSVYTKTGDDDVKVHSGSKSLYMAPGSDGTKLIPLLNKTGMKLEVGKNYSLEMWVYFSDITYTAIMFNQTSNNKNVWQNVNAKDIDFGGFGHPGYAANTWYKKQVFFTATQEYLVLQVEGTGGFYMDDVSVTEVKNDTVVTFQPNNGENIKTATGAEGAALTVPAFTKEGYYIAGWYTDQELTNVADVSVFPAANVTYYAKWLKNGSVVQDFEKFDQTDKQANTGANKTPFSVYTKTGDDDVKVHSGSKSLYMAPGSDGTKLIPLLNKTGMKLEVGKNYSLEMWVYFSDITYTAIMFNQTSNNKNVWQNVNAKDIDFGGFGHPGYAANTWYKKQVFFTATQEYLVLQVEGTGGFYMDDVSVTEVVANVDVTLKPGNGAADEIVSGAPGTEITYPNFTKEGYYIEGWYTDEALTKRFAGEKFTEESLTLYAKWLPNGTKVQTFENFTGNYPGFTLHTEDTINSGKVHSGYVSLKYDNQGSSKPFVVNDAAFGKLTVGQTYRIDFWLYAETATGSGGDFTQLNDAGNAWSYGNNKKIGITYIGTNFRVNEWTKQTVYFTAEKDTIGMLIWGKDILYFDDITVTEVDTITVTVNPNNGEAAYETKGPAGAKLTVDNPTPPQGKTFAGWYTDANLTKRYKIDKYPETAISIYAKYIQEGSYEQGFEDWPYESGSLMMSPCLNIYTATSDNDPNVYEGTHSVVYDKEEAGGTYALGLFDNTMEPLTVGEKYIMTVHYKLDHKYDEMWTNKNTGGFSPAIYYVTQKTNMWTWTSEGERFTAKPYAFHDNTKLKGNIGEEWVGSGTAVKTDGVIDANGWITVTYEFTAKEKFIALYMGSASRVYIDGITIVPLPSGLAEENYEQSYCEDFYNKVTAEAETVLNSTGKKSFEIATLKRDSMVFSASLKKGKVYLAWDAAGKNAIEGTTFVGNGSSLKRFSTRIVTDFSEKVYLIVEGGGAGSGELIQLFRSQYGNLDNPNPDYTDPVANYNSLKQEDAATVDLNAR